MNILGKTQSGTLIIEIDETELQHLAHLNDFDVLRDDSPLPEYDRIGMERFVCSEIFGSQQYRRLNNDACDLMARYVFDAVADIEDRFSRLRGLFELRSGCTQKRMLFREIDEYLEEKPGFARREYEKLLRKMRHPIYSKDLRKFEQVMSNRSDVF